MAPENTSSTEDFVVEVYVHTGNGGDGYDRVQTYPCKVPRNSMVRLKHRQSSRVSIDEDVQLNTTSTLVPVVTIHADQPGSLGYRTTAKTNHGIILPLTTIVREYTPPAEEKPCLNPNFFQKKMSQLSIREE